MVPIIWATLYIQKIPQITYLTIYAGLIVYCYLFSDWWLAFGQRKGDGKWFIYVPLKKLGRKSPRRLSIMKTSSALLRLWTSAS